MKAKGKVMCVHLSNVNENNCAHLGKCAATIGRDANEKAGFLRESEEFADILEEHRVWYNANQNDA